MQIKDVKAFLNECFPFETAEEWDNVGLLVGRENNFVHKIGLTLDVTSQVIEEAEAQGVDLLISHHPVIFAPLKTLLYDSIPYQLACADISNISVHTPLDRAINGVSEQLAKKISLKDIRHDDNEPIIVFGKLPEKKNIKDFAEFLRLKLKGCVRYTNIEKEIETVAVCGGSGGSFLLSYTDKVDAFVTGDAGHHDFIDAAEQDTALLACGHFETEYIVLPYLKTLLEEKYKNDIEIVILEQNNPISYI